MPKDKKHIYKMALLAAASLVWLIVRTGRKPSRIVYPCQKAAVANIHVFFVMLVAPLLELRGSRNKFSHLLSPRTVGTLALVTFLLVAFEAVPITLDSSLRLNSNPYVQLTLTPQFASSSGASDLFIVQNASGSEGSTDTAFSTLLQLMENHSLSFYKTSNHPKGLIARDDVVLIKVNSQWPQRGGTNTDLLKSIIMAIVNHPEGFVGEIVVADNGQGSGSLDRTESNAFNHSQSMKKVVDMFPSNNVSTWLWDNIRTVSVGEYSQGDFTDGYVVNSTENSFTHVKVSYPKFKTKYGTYISFKFGIWSNTTNTYNSEKLKIINVPVLKSHSTYGVTACVKHYMGVPSQALTGTHSVIGDGALATIMAEARFPVLNILDAIWINPIPMGNTGCGPETSYADASFTNIIGASIDPVALDYWMSKQVLMPAATERGYANSSLDPNNPSGIYHQYLVNSMNELKRANFNVTMNETEMNVYLTTPRALNTTRLEFSFLPNPAYAGQTVTLLGNLTDKYSQPVSNVKVNLFVNGTLAGNLFTNSSGWFQAYGKVSTPGTYNITAFYNGSQNNNPSGHTEILAVHVVTIKVWTDKTAYHVGETVKVYVRVKNGGSTLLVRATIALKLSNGNLYPVLNMTTTLPANYDSGDVLWNTFTIPTALLGNYTWIAELRNPTTGALISQSTWSWSLATTARAKSCLYLLNRSS